MKKVRLCCLWTFVVFFGLNFCDMTIDKSLKACQCNEYEKCRTNFDLGIHTHKCMDASPSQTSFVVQLKEMQKEHKISFFLNLFAVVIILFVCTHLCTCRDASTISNILELYCMSNCLAFCMYVCVCLCVCVCVCACNQKICRFLNCSSSN
jgi:hypothetical protein